MNGQLTCWNPMDHPLLLMDHRVAYQKNAESDKFYGTAVVLMLRHLSRQRLLNQYGVSVNSAAGLNQRLAEACAKQEPVWLVFSFNGRRASMDDACYDAAAVWAGAEPVHRKVQLTHDIALRHALRKLTTGTVAVINVSSFSGARGHAAAKMETKLRGGYRIAHPDLSERIHEGVVAIAGSLVMACASCLSLTDHDLASGDRKSILANAAAAEAQWCGLYLSNHRIDLDPDLPEPEPRPAVRRRGLDLS